MGNIRRTLDDKLQCILQILLRKEKHIFIEELLTLIVDEPLDEDDYGYIYDFLVGHGIDIFKAENQDVHKSKEQKDAIKKSKEKYLKKLNVENKYSVTDTLNKANINPYEYIDDGDISDILKLINQKGSIQWLFEIIYK